MSKESQRRRNKKRARDPEPPSTTIVDHKPKPIIRVMITAYNRPRELQWMLSDIVTYRGNWPLKVAIYDDASEEDMSGIRRICRKNRFEFVQSPVRNGKHGYHNWMRTIHQMQRDAPGHYFICLPDDYRLCEDFFDKAIDLWESIEDPHKVTLACIRDHRSDEHNSCWNPIRAHEVGRVIETGFVDGTYIAERRYLKMLHYGMPKVHPKTWDWNPARGSGIGQVISVQLHQAGLKMYSPQESLVVHTDSPSRMNPAAREENDLAATRFVEGDAIHEALRSREPVTAALASIPSRELLLMKVVNSIIDQVDELCVYLNEYERVPGYLDRPRITVARSQDHGDRGDAGKFFWAGQREGYCLHLDDDIAYPPNYTARMIRAIAKYERKAVVGLHGIRLPHNPTSYYRGRQVFHCRHTVAGDNVVHMIGTGTVAYHSSTISVTPEDFRVPNMADIWLGIVAKTQEVPMVALAHTGDWLHCMKDPQGHSIFETYKGRDNEQTKAVREAAPWPAPGPLP